MSEIKNRFSWSSTRDSTFQTCLRQYYYNYYGFWGGWRSDASARTQQIYVLKQLQSRHMWAGDKIHGCIQRSLVNLRRGVSLLNPEEAIDITLKSMRSDFRSSRAKEYWKAPKTCALFEHEYDVPIQDEEWRSTADHVAVCLRAFYASSLWEQLRSVPAQDWLEVEEFSHFLLDGITVFVKLDCCFKDRGRVTVWDWKTGRAQQEAHVIQMVCYTLYACEKWKIGPDHVTASEILLPNMAKTDYQATPPDIEAAKSYIRGSLSDMISLLKDAHENVPQEEAAFGLCEGPRPCQTCNFKKICPKW